jgi:hypothetical protein
LSLSATQTRCRNQLLAGCSQSQKVRTRILHGERPGDAAEYAAAVRIEAQMLRHRSHDKLMKAFLGPEVFEGTVLVAPRLAAASEQLRLSGA